MADAGATSSSISTTRNVVTLNETDIPPDRGSSYSTIGSSSTQQIQDIIGGGPSVVTYYYMRAIESGGGCGSPTYRYWESVNDPDLTGASYTGTRCSPPGTLSDFTILRSRTV